MQCENARRAKLAGPGRAPPLLTAASLRGETQGSRPAPRCDATRDKGCAQECLPLVTTV